MLRAASESVDDARDARRRSSSADLSGADLIALQAYMERAQLQRESAALELDRREAEVDARRAALTQRSQERQVLEKLKERRAEDHRVESERRESVVLDEMALNMHRRTESAL